VTLTRTPTYETIERAFPAFSPERVRIYIMPSFGDFHGMTQIVDGRLALLIGLDNLAQESSAVPVFLSHELFHIYHHEINPAFFATPGENDLYNYGLYRELWAEGMATHIARPCAISPEVATRQSRRLWHGR
jgi:Putative zinc dependent peptidase (DUF5700)